MKQVWPECQEAKPPSSEASIDGKTKKKCSLAFKPIRDASAEDLKYPLCDVICPNKGEVDTGMCDARDRCNGPCVVDQRAIDRQYLEFAWRLFVSMNVRESPEALLEWLTWDKPVRSTIEANSALADGQAGLSPPFEHLKPLNAASTRSMHQPDMPAGVPQQSHSTWYGSSDQLARVRFQVLTNSESPYSHKSIVTDACAQALQAASAHGLDARYHWWRAKSEDRTGPVHLKAAWIQVPKGACDKDFLCGLGKGELRPGLVALHVTTNTSHSHGYWTWATFEHAKVADGSLGLFLKEQAGNPNPPPTRITKLPLTYDGAADYQALVDAINKEASATLERESKVNTALSVLKHYRLVGVQRPRDDGTQIEPWPPRLSNVVIELDQDSSCMGCHSHALSWRICKSNEAGCLRCNAGCPSVKLDWVPQERNPARSQADMFWGYARTPHRQTMHPIGTQP